MYSVEYTKRFARDVKRCAKRGLNIAKLQVAANILAETGTLPIQYRPHKLTGNYAGCWECHIEPDWLLVWEQDDFRLTLLFLHTGKHSDIF